MENKISMNGQMDLYKKALDASWKRNQVINENIANVDTVNYKRKDIRFNQALSQAIDDRGRVDQSKLDQIQIEVYSDRKNLSYRLDGNNVDMDTEMVRLAENQLKYNTMVSNINYNFRRLKSVMNR